MVSRQQAAQRAIIPLNRGMRAGPPLHTRAAIIVELPFAGVPQFAPAAGDFMLQVETWMLARIDQAQSQDCPLIYLVGCAPSRRSLRRRLLCMTSMQTKNLAGHSLAYLLEGLDRTDGFGDWGRELWPMQAICILYSRTRCTHRLQPAHPRDRRLHIVWFKTEWRAVHHRPLTAPGPIAGTLPLCIVRTNLRAPPHASSSQWAFA